MGLYDDLKPNSQPQQKTSGMFDDLAVPKKEGIASSVFGTVKAAGKGFLDMFTNPSEAQKAYEANYLPYAPKSNPIIRAITAPGVASMRVATRLLNPGLMPLADDVANIYEVSRKGGIADQVKEGKIPASYLDDIAVLKKNGYNITGDVAQAVLSLYGGSAVKNVATAGAKEGVKQAFIAGAKETAPVGLLFGAAQVASEGETDIKKIASTLGVSTAMAMLLGGMVRGTVPATKSVSAKIAKLFEEKKIKVPVVSESVPSNIKVNTPNSRYSDYRASQGYEPYVDPNTLPVIEGGAPLVDKNPLPTVKQGENPKVFVNYPERLPEPYIPQDKLPIIEMGEKLPDKSGLPTIQMNDTPEVFPGDMTYHPIDSITKTTSGILRNGKQAPELIQQIYKPIKRSPEVAPPKVRPTKTSFEVPDEFQQKKIELEIRKEALNQSPFNKLDARRYQKEGDIRELGDVTNKKVADKMQNDMGEVGIEDATKFQEEYTKFREKKAQFIQDEKIFKQEVKDAKSSFKSEVASLEDVAKQADISENLATHVTEKYSDNNFSHQTNKQQIETVLKKDVSEIIDVAMGRKAPTDGIPATSHLAVAEKIAEDMAKKGDTSLALELMNSNVGRKAGQNLQSLAIASEDSLVSILRDTRVKLEDNMSVLRKTQMGREINKAIAEIKDAFKNLKDIVPTKEAIAEALAKITCK
jgi:hypothetical protein